MGEELNEEFHIKDEEPELKRIHLSETLFLEEETLEPSYWDTLPYTATVQVYSYLKVSDRRAMARVCQAWNKCSKDPSLWRSTEFIFGSPCVKRKCVKMIQFASNSGSYLNDVVIRCPRRTLKSCNYKFIPEMMENLMVELENARLSRLKFVDLESRMDKVPVKFKDTLGRCLVRLLKSQTALKHVELINCHLIEKPGTEVLKALQESSGQTLESLELGGFFQTSTRYFHYRLLKSQLLYTDLEKFTNLKEIRCPYSYISETIFQRWTVDLKNKLEHMTLDVMFNRDHLITSTAWRKLAMACPQLKVDVNIFSYFFESEMIELLAPEIPLSKLYMSSDVRKDQDRKLAALLSHIADNFDQKLESLRLVLPYLQDSVDNEIVRVVETCQKLTAICVPASAAFGVANVICNDFKEGQVRNVNLQIGRAKNMSNSDQDILKTIRDMFREFPNLTVAWDDDEYIY